ncbi:MAG: ankyrin repeat domain-containing protein [Gammaproteobacteria bacterium]|nr:ankyrin repeat domain-containing protein [Gammaproteobacteria bacterium]
MDAETRQAIEHSDWNGVRTRLLELHRESRAAVGLGTTSPLSALQLAALHDAEAAQRLLDRGLPCDAHSAAALGRLDDLRRHAGDFSDLAEHLTPMGFALLKGRLDSVEALLDAGDDPNRPLPRIGFFVWEPKAIGSGTWAPLHMASAHGYHADAGATVAALIRSGAHMAARCPLGETALHLAATFGWRPVLECLLANGANIDEGTARISPTIHGLASPKHAPVAHRQTPLMIAAREGGVDTVAFLVEQGASIDASDSNGATALHIAARPWWRENVELLEALLAAGARRDVRDSRGRTPLDLARAAGFSQTAAALEGK